MTASTRTSALMDNAVRPMQTGNLDTDDDVRLSYFRWGSEDTRTPVALHHGFAASTQANWVAPRVVAALLKAGHAVISIDARGHGQSEKPHDAGFYGEPRMARDLIALLDHLEVREFDLVGYSMGAVVSLIVASQESRLRRMVVGGIGEGVLATGGVDLRVMDRGAIVAGLLTDDPASITAPGVAEFRSFAERNGSDLKALAAQAERMHDQPIDLQRIAAPTLVLAGDKDPLAFHPERLAAAIAHGSSATVPGDHLNAVGHPLFAEATIEFLGR
ncbi:MAG TPA: alpha/beta fold hydrolase [Dokdonella sp.]|uniref:alpha/beta fold hydrolase n=1 Tax=Dokdonella sp. TaxID=2291710 RepID=UPI002D7F7BB7|nr:alpha/beta fold hydrolase [Dokdonella sp.]HET9033223.1 alpha/beta fold hydrolase [Dokdonella sp.]